jgi:hypothetical protein
MLVDSFCRYTYCSPHLHIWHLVHLSSFPPFFLPATLLKTCSASFSGLVRLVQPLAPVWFGFGLVWLRPGLASALALAMDFPGPLPRRGDWFMPVAGRHRFWSGPPSTPLENTIIRHPLMPRTDFYVGPVHSVIVTEHYISVEVPHPVHHPEYNILVWLNVWSNRNNRGQVSSVWFARDVPVETLHAWQLRGWVDVYLS